jgi:hypothetical protein
VGALTGLFAGFSNSPVVGILLPLLFGLIAGTGGAYIANMKLDSSEDKRRAKFIGQALFLFSAACLSGAMYAMAIRTGAGWKEFVPSFQKQEQKTVNLPAALQLNGSRLTELALVRAQLKMLGATTQDQAIVIQRLADDFQITAPLPKVTADVLLTNLQAVVKKFEAPSRPGSQPAKDISGRVALTQAKFKTYARILGEWAAAGVKPERRPEFETLLGEVRTLLHEVSADEDLQEWLALSGGPLEEILAFRLVTGPASLRSGTLDASDDLQRNLIATLQIMHGQPPDRQQNLERVIERVNVGRLAMPYK